MNRKAQLLSVLMIGTISFLVQLRSVTAQEVIRPQVVIVLDTSSSMGLAPDEGAENNISGADCGGDRNGVVDFCDDGMCSGAESLTSCSQDCTIVNNQTPLPGMAVACKNINAASRKTSRMYMVKRVLRRILPPLRDKVSVGLATFSQSGYFKYFKTDPASVNVEQVTVYLPRLQLELMGVWGSNAPAGSFTADGTTYTLISQAAGLSQGADSLYKNSADATEERRFAFATAGLQYSNGGKDWDYLGSYYTFTTRGLYGLWKGTNGCSSSSRCSVGEGDCDNNNQCLPGLVCSSDVGQRYWEGDTIPDIPNASNDVTIANIDVCEAPPSAEFRGPQYTENNDEWVYYRYTWNPYGMSNQGITASGTGTVVVNLPAAETQTSIDGQLLKLLVRFNLSTNGGLVAVGNTPTGPALETAGQHIVDRAAGTGPFAGLGTDSWAFCRARFILLLTDGQSNEGIDPATAAQNVYNLYADNPIRTLVVALPGLPSSAMTELQEIADMGDNGIDDTPDSAAPFAAQNEGELIKAIEDAITLGIYGGEIPIGTCLETCNDQNPCAPGYVCYNNQYCIPEPPPPPPDAGVPDVGILDASVSPDLPIVLPDASPVIDAPYNPDGPVVPADAGSDAPSVVDQAPGLDVYETVDTKTLDGETVEDGNNTTQDSSEPVHLDISTSQEFGSAKLDGGAGQKDMSSNGGPSGGEGGCDCSLSADPSFSYWLLLLALLPWRRRRGRLTTANHRKTWSAHD